MATQPRLTYFDGRGYGELIRMTLCAAGIEFTECNMESREEFLQMKAGGKMLYGQLPLLEIDGQNLVQRRAILHYLAIREGLYGSNLTENGLVEMYFEGSRDFMNSFDFLVFDDVEPILQDYRKKFFPRYLPVFEKILEASSSGYLVGKGMTLADISLLEPLLTAHEQFGEGVLDGYPKLKEFYKMMTTLPNIAAFLKGPHRRQSNTPEHVKDVCEIVAMEFHR
ncbi:glutathione S-transferase A4-like [Haliotis rubra]|uniref:glutathione S-transferase A4-like n=1 Tax=Haliotis rubra TaxID=36100 RepID=UPI001EE58174|nr:glutathione S-transferase A4-like [Haliotis rubra]XP_046572513.1 glutathione S-transferase A4-like [Haliotis rubra]